MGAYDTMLKLCRKQIVSIYPGLSANQTALAIVCGTLTQMVSANHKTTGVLDFENITPVSAGWWISGVLCTIIACLTVVLNTLSIWVFTRRQGRSPTNILLAIISGLDLLTCVCQLPLLAFVYLAEGYTRLPGRFWCDFYNYVYNFAPAALHSIAFLLNMCLSVQRFVGVKGVSRCGIKALCGFKGTLIAIGACVLASVTVHAVYPITIGVEGVNAISKQMLSEGKASFVYVESCRVSPRYPESYDAMMSVYIWARVVILQTIPALVLGFCNIALITASFRTYSYRRRLIGKMGAIATLNQSLVVQLGAFSRLDDDLQELASDNGGSHTGSRPDEMQTTTRPPEEVSRNNISSVYHTRAPPSSEQLACKTTNQRLRAAISTSQLERPTHLKRQASEKPICSHKCKLCGECHIESLHTNSSNTICMYSDETSFRTTENSHTLEQDNDHMDKNTYTREGQYTYHQRKSNVCDFGDSFSSTEEDMFYFSGEDALFTNIHSSLSSCRHFSIRNERSLHKNDTIVRDTAVTLQPTTSYRNLPDVVLTRSNSWPIKSSEVSYQPHPSCRHTDIDTINYKQESQKTYTDRHSIFTSTNSGSSLILSNRHTDALRLDSLFTLDKVECSDERNNEMPSCDLLHAVVDNSTNNTSPSSGTILNTTSAGERACVSDTPRPSSSYHRSGSGSNGELRSTVMLVLVTSFTLLAEIFVIIMLIFQFIDSIALPQKSSFVSNSQMGLLFTISNLVTSLTFPLNFFIFCGLSHSFRSSLRDAWNTVLTVCNTIFKRS